MLGDAIEALISMVVALAVAILRLAAKGAWWLVRHPRVAIPVAIVAGLLVWWGPAVTGLYLTMVAIAALAWRIAHPESFARLVAFVAPAASRRVRRYRRRWVEVMTMSGLAASWDGATVVPRLAKVSTGRWGDRLLVGLVPGQEPADLGRKAHALAHAFGARAGRVRTLRPGWVWLELATGDPLAEPIGALDPPEHCNLEAVPVGRRDDGAPWCLRVLGGSCHTLIAGATGAGKGSVLWSLIRGLWAAIRDGSVQLWVIDLKGGMELAPGRAMFHRFECGEIEAVAQLLKDAVAVMRERAARLAGVVRQHVPTPEEPLIVVVIDEVATITAYLGDKKLRDEIDRNLRLLLSQGRAVGVSVVAALQDPRKDTMAARELFPTRVALRLRGESETDMVLGDGARAAGARCDEIAESLPGVGYVMIDGSPEPVRVRAAYVSDDDIDRMAAEFAGRPEDGPDGSGELVGPSPQPSGSGGLVGAPS